MKVSKVFLNIKHLQCINLTYDLISDKNFDQTFTSIHVPSLSIPPLQEVNGMCYTGRAIITLLTRRY